MSTPIHIKTFTIDGRGVSAREGELVLQIARDNGIYIPTLCQIEWLSSVGACRLCLVEVKGRPKLVPACTLSAEEGIEVITQSERLSRYRRMILELLFSERNHICSVCVSNSHCDLQDLAQKLGVTHVSLPYRNPVLKVDASHKQFAVDHNRCVLCTRCVRVCDEIEGAHVWDVMGRGIESRVIVDFDQTWATSETCTNCGKCVQVCPTGALFEKGKAVGEMLKKREFLNYLTIMREARGQ